MSSFDYNYDYDYDNIIFKKNDPRYRIGRGEQGVLLVRPYKDNLLKYWKFETFELSKKSAKDIYKEFLKYRRENDFVGMDMARKYLEMGYTRSMRYAKHKDGKKYDKEGNILPLKKDKEKLESALVFKEYRDKAFNDTVYKEAKRKWKLKEKK